MRVNDVWTDAFEKPYQPIDRTQIPTTPLSYLKERHIYLCQSIRAICGRILKDGY